MKLNYFFVLLFLFVIGTVTAKVINVPGDAATIQEGINMSENGDTVLVAPGTYVENINFKGKNIHVASHFILARDRTKIEETIIDGGNPSDSDTASCVLIISGEDRNAILEGFTLTKGKGTLWEDEHGAGLYYEGGGVLIALSSPIVRNNIITGNNVARVSRDAVSAGGGGIRLGDGSPLIEHNIVTNNRGMYGGGIVSNYATPVIRNNIVTGNKSVEVNFQTPTFGGGGIWINGSGNAEVYNNIVINNTANDGSSTPYSGNGGGILAAGKCVIKNNIIWGNNQSNGNQFDTFGGTEFQFNCVEGGYTGPGNIDTDPKFVDESYQLADDSPCIDAGAEDEIFNDIADPANSSNALFPALGTIRNDLGIYGGPNPMDLLPVPTSVEEILDLPRDFYLDQNYPNPFNPSTTISFYLKNNGKVSLNVYNLLGELVDTIIEKELNMGRHSIQYKPANLTSGIYFYTLVVNERVVGTKKLVLIK